MAHADARVGKRYAQALFKTALAYDVVNAVEDDLTAIVGLIQKDKSFRDFVLAPYTSREEKVKIVERIFSDRITALTMQLFRVMLEKRRETEIEAVWNEFVALRREHGATLHVSVTSAELLEEDQRKALLAKLEKSTGKKVEATFNIDARLLGGIKVAYGSYVLDGSVRGSLDRLRDKLKHDLLKQN